MSTFSVEVVEVEIMSHDNADNLEIAKVGGYTSIVSKGDYVSDDKAVYIPEQSILPDDVIEDLGLIGRLSGKAKNRVKAVKLRGVLSQGLLHPLFFGRLSGRNYAVGDDVQDDLGITKYVPLIPESMSGDVKNSLGLTLNYDIENFKRDPMLIDAGIEMVATEKIHGTWCCFGITVKEEDTIVTSKGLSSKHLSFKLDEGINTTNLYVKKWREFGTSLRNTILTLPYYILGEIYGRGVQDLQYGLTGKNFRVFDVYMGNPGSGGYLPWDLLLEFCKEMNLKNVPSVERFIMPGSLDERKELLNEISSRSSLVGLKGSLMEGVVIRPIYTETRNTQGCRWIQKFINEKYLLRKGNITEFE